jgi:hypothetical protein
MPLAAVPAMFPSAACSAGELEWRIVDAIAFAKSSCGPGAGVYGETSDGGPPGGVTAFAET